ncbi:recombinase family protein [Parablautia muri]|uniref:recombinase family protein n=1 Tax=Parablautia muri TaxID=2320879 RepID=UPI002412859B|nr:recombinase family protein [Parablautia muri]
MRCPERAEKDGRVRAWDNVSVRAVLNNRFYLGEMAYGKSKRKSAGSKAGIDVPMEEWKVIPDHHEPLVIPEDYEKVCLFHKGADTARKGEKNPLVGKLFCGGCGYSMTYKPLRGKNKYRRYECRKHEVLQIRSRCTYFNADLLEETVLTMLNRELMVRGDAAKENQSLISFQKSCIARLEKKITECRGRKKQLQAEADALYESYAFGAACAVSYRQKADSIKEQTASLSAEEEKHGKELEQLQEEYRRTEEDMKQVIRYSHLEVLTQEVVDIFIKKIYVLKDKRVETQWNFRENGKETE